MALSHFYSLGILLPSSEQPENLVKISSFPSHANLLHLMVVENKPGASTLCCERERVQTRQLDEALSWPLTFYPHVPSRAGHMGRGFDAHDGAAGRQLETPHSPRLSWALNSSKTVPPPRPWRPDAFLPVNPDTDGGSTGG